MEATNPPRGLILDLITPLDEKGRLDGRSLGRLLDRALPYAQGILISSPNTGEGRNLSIQQREELLEKCLVVVRGRVPILVWISGDTEEKTLSTLSSMQKILEKRGYPGEVFWVDSPLLYHSNRGLPDFYRSISHSMGHGFILYNDPGLIGELDRPFKRNNIRTSILKEIANIEKIRGMLFFGSFERAGNYQKATGIRKNFMIYDGDESHFLRHPSLAGLVSAGANIAPKAWQRITGSSLGTNSSKKEYPDSQRQIWDMGGFLIKLRETYRKNSVPIIKHGLAHMEILGNPRSFGDDKNIDNELKELKNLLEEYENFL